MTRPIGGTCYFKVDGQALSLSGGIEVSVNTEIREDMVGLDGSVDYKVTHRVPYVKGTFKVHRHFPLEKLMSQTDMTLTAELATGRVYVLSGAWLSGEANHNAEEGSIELEFHGKEGFYQ